MLAWHWWGYVNFSIKLSQLCCISGMPPYSCTISCRKYAPKNLTAEFAAIFSLNILEAGQPPRSDISF